MIPFRMNPLGISVNENLPLTLTAEQAGSTVTLNAYGSPTVSGLHYRLGKSGIWLPYTIGTTIMLANAGDSVQFWNSATRLGTSSSNYCKFVLTGTISARGNVLSLINFSRNCYAWSFYQLFNENHALITSPEIPADTLGESCCRGMLRNTDITEAPDIRATLLIYTCCYDMLTLCTSLLRFPRFSANTANGMALYGMCAYDTSLTSANLESIEEVKTDSLTNLFNGCKSLNEISVGFTSWTYNGNSCTKRWVSGVASSGTFIKPTALPEEYGVDRIPEGWTVVNK